MPARIDSRVVLPAPLGPITATSSPRPAESETPRRASRSPKRLTRSRAASAAVTAVSTAGRLAESPVVKLLFVGDVVGGIGRRTLAALLPGLREEHQPDFVVVNGENAAGGVGITARPRASCSTLGADAITLGNHAYRHREVYEYLDEEPRIVRPANYPKGSPGPRPHGGRGERAAPRRGQPLGPGVPRGRALAVRRGRRAAGRAARRRPTPCSWTCTPRPRARRSRWAGTSTGA